MKLYNNKKKKNMRQIHYGDAQNAKGQIKFNRLVADFNQKSMRI